MTVNTRYGDITINRLDKETRGRFDYDYIVYIRGLYTAVRIIEDNVFRFEEDISNSVYEEKKDRFVSDEDFIIESLTKHLRNRVINIQNIINMLIEAKRK